MSLLVKTLLILIGEIVEDILEEDSFDKLGNF